MAIRPSESRCAISSTVMRAIEYVMDISPRLGAAVRFLPLSGFWPDEPHAAIRFVNRMLLSLLTFRCYI